MRSASADRTLAGVDATPAVTAGGAVVQSWVDSFGRSRLQVIVPVRNDGPGWIRLPVGASTYEVVANELDLARGALMALPDVIGPGETAYLVDTVTIPDPASSIDLAAVADVVAVAAERPARMLSVTGLELTTGIGGGPVAIGQAHNESVTRSAPVIVGIIALDKEENPITVLYDLFDVGRLDPAEIRPFVTDSQPGGPPTDDVQIAKLVGIAFEATP